MNSNKNIACILKNDRYEHINICACGTSCLKGCSLIVVCNGIGTGNAAQDTVKGMLGDFAKTPGCTRSLMGAMIFRAQLELITGGSGEKTTFAAVMASKNRVIAAHSGNTRIYITGERGLIYISSDHSVGAVSASPDMTDGKRLYSALGVEDDRFKYEIREYDALVARKVLICTDGFHMTAGESVIPGIMEEARSAPGLLEAIDKETKAASGTNRAAAVIIL